MGYGIAHYQGEIVQVANYRDPEGRVVAQKIRTKDKDFRTIGDFKGIGLWGRASGGTEAR